MRHLFPLILLAAACGDVTNPDEDNEGEVITTAELTFTAGGTDIVVSWADPENDGSPVIDDLTLDANTDYTVSVVFLNELEDPAEDITEEVDEEADEHQVFFTGSAVGIPATMEDPLATYTYGDTDDDGLPVGLTGTFATGDAGTGDLVVTLRHLPPEDGTAVKVEGLADDALADGFGGIPGDSDFQGTFSLTVE